MVTSGLMEFNDQPENYWAWKTSFRSVIDELTLSPREELDLLIKWLGPASKEQARRIRAINSHNSAAGLSMVWQRLKETYGSPEAVEHSLLKRIEEFPRISNRDNVRLRELGDILLELEYAKEGGYLPGLAYLDTSRGVNPILEKLPFSLQEKWISQGSKYKECNHVPYPPFTFFSQFIRSEAKTRNDPSFMISQAHYSGPTKTERPTRYKVPVSVRKTDVFSEARAAPTGSVEKRAMDPDRLCPLHNKPHALRKCRTFRSKPIEERKTYLREKNICFRCCGSTNHRAKDCDKEIVCRECGSKTHTSALHPGPAPWFSEVSADQGEEEETHETPPGTLPAVTSKCTEVCGGNTNAKSCCRICLVKVYPEDHPGKICMEFFRISNVDLLGKFNASLDKYTTPLLKLYRKRTDAFGEEMKSLLDKLDEQVSDITTHRKKTALEGLPLFLRENPASLLNMCLITERAKLEAASLSNIKKEHNLDQETIQQWVCDVRQWAVTVQSIYDPLGFVAPITIQGKVLIRELSSKEYDWDDPLPPDKQESWKLWRESLLELEKLHFKRRYVPMPLVSSQSRELCLFSDASTQAIAAVAYLRVTNDEDQCHVGFVMGKAKLAPHPAHTVPRLELCAAVLATEMADTICCEMDIEMHAVRFFTDSRIVLGYIHNTSRRFHVYVANRVNRIRKSSHSQQWQYFATEQNPADHATRPMSVDILRASNWFSGPEFLKSSSEPPQSDSFGLVNPELDVEVRAQVAVNYTKATEGQFSTARFERYSSRKRLLQAITKLIQVTRTYSKTQNVDAVDARWQAKTVVIRCVQQEFYGEELKCLGDGIQLSKKSSLRKLNPFIDEDWRTPYQR
ncbi:hypothetical protein ROHU_013330 [Labeo rohita]|uniref:Uncharacterized protein n=1 Tax=Labeo rohita TaxID=84645 RepID=A0A498LDV0_LABRO|nr:hypothetical protein ROHU_013330 [Labeo rohita]